MSRELESWLRYYRDMGFTHLYRKKAAPSRDEPGPAAHSNALGGREGAGNLKPHIDSNAAAIPPAVALSAPQPPISLLDAPASRETLEEIRQDLGDCKRCKLWKERKSIVFGSGNPKAELVFVGEGPGADEDEQGLPFVGRAGQLLTEMIEKGMKISRSDVYICNIIKCRPPANRKPEKDEVAACRQFVERQLDAVHPRVICALGATAAETLLGVRQSMGSLRGQWFQFHGIPLVVSYHPAFLLRDPSKKREAWEDLKTILAFLNSGAAPSSK